MRQVAIIKGDPPEVKLTIGENDFFGEQSLITGEKTSASIRTVEFTELMMLSKHHFDQVVES